MITLKCLGHLDNKEKDKIKYNKKNKRGVRDEKKRLPKH